MDFQEGNVQPLEQKLTLQPVLKKAKFPFGVSNHTITPTLSIEGDGPKTSCFYLILMFIKPLWSWKEIIQAHTFFRLIWRGVLIKHDKKRNYFKSKSMNLPKAIDIYRSVDHVMNIVILACRTCLFFHHLWINWIVRGRVRQGGMGDGTGNGSSAVCIPGTFWSQVDINLIREAPLAFCLLQTIKQHNCVRTSLSNCSTITRIED